jgi:hypothetical protein
MRFPALPALLAATVIAGAAGACISPDLVLTQLLEARRLASDTHVQFTQAADAANRAVMADTDEGATAAANEARRARQAVERNVVALETILQAQGYRADLRVLAGFKERFDEYRRLDDEILPLAVENTNVKAQRLSFGPVREAADAFRSALERAVKATGRREPCQSDALAARAVSALRQVQVLQGPHIAEADSAAMTRMEEQMTASEADARQAVHLLKATLPPSASPYLGEALAALDRFDALHTELIALSRRNSDVHSLALSLGRKRVVSANCADHLRALEEALAKHEFTATR